MKKLLIIATAVIICGGLIWFTGRNQKASAPSLTFATVQTDIKSGAKLYDVRTADEYKSGHFPGATNWSLQDMQAGKLPDVAKTTKIFVYCHSGNRSSQATTALQGAGYTNVTDLHGLSAVEAIGGTLVN